jgi:hypothetical protein
MHRELVIRGAEVFMPRRASVERAVYIALQMLDSYTYGKGLATHRKAAELKIFEGIARRMTYTQKQVFCLYLPAGGNYTRQSSV